MRLREVLKTAANRHVGIGHFNISDLVGFNAVISAMRQLNVPALIGVSEGERDFIGVGQIATLIRFVRDEYGCQVFLNADHTHSLEKARTAAKAGFDEIIFDLSDLPWEENIKQTRQAVELLKSINPEVLIEGEIGHIGRGSEIIEKAPELVLTSPEEAAQFVSETKVDILAPSVGNMHGLLPSMIRGEIHKRLDIPRIRGIRESTGVYLTLHGGSGTADEDFVAGIKAGLTILHINTELRVAWRRGLEEGLKAHPNEVTPYKILPQAVDAVQKTVLGRLKLFNRDLSSLAA